MMPVKPIRAPALVAVFAGLSITLAACGSRQTSTDGTPLSAVAQIGALAFADPSLSASGRLSCASCHAAETGHAAPTDLSVQLGGPDGTAPGLRSSPSLRYLATHQAFGFDEDGKPAGGFFWDGRASSLTLQAQGPLLGDREMANLTPSAVVAKIARASWVEKFKAVFGADILSKDDQAFEKLTLALSQFQLEDARFNAFTSKFDAVLRGQATMNPQEQRGLTLFNDPAKGNCAACHTSEKGLDGRHPLFTDFSYDNLGVPRNPSIPANADPNYFDLGLCARPDLRHRTDLCGAFKVPSLRNVALRKSFFHNGRFKSLRDALSFYVQRDTAPEKWYPINPDGTVRKFDDLPTALHGNINTSEAPYDRLPGMSPALSETDIEDVLQFLATLTDGWKPIAPAP